GAVSRCRLAVGEKVVSGRGRELLGRAPVPRRHRNRNGKELSRSDDCARTGQIGSGGGSTGAGAPDLAGRTPSGEFGSAGATGAVLHARCSVTGREAIARSVGAERGARIDPQRFAAGSGTTGSRHSSELDERLRIRVPHGRRLAEGAARTRASPHGADVDSWIRWQCPGGAHT